MEFFDTGLVLKWLYYWYYGIGSKILNTSRLPKRPRQTGQTQTQIRLLLKKQSDQGLPCFTASNLCLLLQKEQNVNGGEGPSGKQAVGINNGTR